MHRIQYKAKWPYITISIVFVLFALQGYGCIQQTKSTTKIKVLATRPLSDTMVSDYPSIYTLHQSDKKIVLVGIWGKDADIGDHVIRWEIYDGKGEMVYATDDLSLNVRPHLLSSYTLRINERMRQRMSSGVNTVMLFIDNELINTHPLAYNPESIVNENIRGAVFFPVSFTNSSVIGESFSTAQKHVIQNTFSAAIFSEVVRVIPRTIPHYVVEEKIGEEYNKDCFDDAECLKRMEDLFSEVLFIGGNVDLGWYEEDLETLSLYIHNPETGEMKVFEHSILARQGTEKTIFQDLINGVLYKKGFLDYLSNL